MVLLNVEMTGGIVLQGKLIAHYGVEATGVLHHAMTDVRGLAEVAPTMTQLLSLMTPRPTLVPGPLISSWESSHLYIFLLKACSNFCRSSRI